LGGSGNKQRGRFVAVVVVADDGEVLVHARRKGRGFYRHVQVRKGGSTTCVDFKGSQYGATVGGRHAVRQRVAG
jgi:hypothetical protein